MDTLTQAKTDPHNMSSLSLAFVGDSVYDLLVREYLATRDGRRVGELNKEKVSLVCCEAQSKAYEVIAPLLTEEEQEVYRRGRNVKVHSTPKRSTLRDYHNATGFEALLGFLYLTGESQRLRNLFSIIIQSKESE